MQSLNPSSDPTWVFHVATELSRTEELPPQELTERARSLVDATRNLRGEHVRELIGEMLVGRGVHLSLQWMHECGLLGIWLPELEATVNFSQEAGRRHKDVWEHTKTVVRQSVPRPEVRWAALLHDIGKVHTRAFLADGGVTFHRHSEVGVRMFHEVQKRFTFERGLKQKLRFLILHHLRPGQYEASWTDSAVRRFDRELQEHLKDLLDLSRADITSARPGKRQAALENISNLQGRIELLRSEDAIQPPLPTGIGNVIMEHFKLAPSRQIGDLKRELERLVEAGELEARREAEYYLAHVATMLPDK
ncbi:MAG: HD domain-containing protein [Polyangia bacterium]